MTEPSFLAELSLKTIPVDASIGLSVACVEITVAGCVCVCVLSLSTNRNIISAPMSHGSSLPTTSSSCLLLTVFPPLIGDVGEVINSVCPLYKL